MKKKYSYFSALCLAAAMAFTACTQDELTDDTLPDGKYPLEIASATIEAESSVQPWGAQTRVMEEPNGAYSEWELTNEFFYVKFDGSDKVGTYQITNINVNSALVKTVEPAYWQSASQPQTIIAWYAPDADADGKLDLSNQNKGLIYVMRAEKKDVTYNNGAAVSLSFEHQLAKVRVQFTGNNASKVENVKIQSYTSCTVTEGTVSTADAPTGYITTCKTTLLSSGTECWEANVAQDYEITTIKVNGAPATLTKTVTPKAGQLCKIEIKVNPIPVTGGTTITEPGDYIVTGSVSETITLNGEGINLTLKDANISVSSGNGIDITSGSPTICVEGTNNTVKSSSGTGIYVAENSTVTITGDNRDDKLTVTGGESSSGIGGYPLGTYNTYANCGNILIQRITLTASGSDNSGAVAPGIGSAGNAACGTITIDNAAVYAHGGTATNQFAPGIGCGYPDSGAPTSIPTVIIKNQSVVHAYRGGNNTDYIGWSGDPVGSTAASNTCNFGTDGSCTGSTVYCYTQTSKDASTLDKTLVYDANGTGTEQ